MPKRIMVVDGSSVSREIAARILRDSMEDAEVIPFGNGAEAIAALSSGQFDLITTSLLLPDIDGLELCRSIRNSRSHQYTPIIVISGDADDRLLKEGFAAGVTDYFDKSQGYQAFGQFINDFSRRSSGVVGRVLFVEDSRVAATVTLRILERHGLVVTHASNAEEALGLLKAARNGEMECFDLVISDYHLGEEMNGGDLLHTIRARHHLSPHELPVLIITGNDDTKTQIELFHGGANDFVRKPLVEEVLMARVRSLLLIKHQYDALQRQTRTIERVANSDALTGVYNRHYLGVHGTAWLRSSRMLPLSVMIIDIDHFKQVNINHGHLVGDHVLAALGGLLKQHYAEGMVVRFGGEEFAVLLPCADEAAASERGEKVRNAVEQLMPDGVAVTISMGIACSTGYPQADLNTLVGWADKALTAAKEGGRNRICIAQQDTILEVELQQASC